MNIVETPDLWVLSLGRRLSIPEIGAAAAECVAAIENEMAARGLAPAGPWIFISESLPRDRESRFPWRACRPVAKPASYDGGLDLIHLAPIRAATAVYEGPLADLFTNGYAPLLAAVETSGHAVSGESREIYHAWHGPDAPDNRIEIQFGLAQAG